MTPLTPKNEARRVEALREYGVLDTAPERLFDDLTALAARFLEVPIALVSLVDERRQWFKSRYGLGAAETPREISFCGHAILSPSPFVVEDALTDARFADNPLVTSDPGIRFYAGAPLLTPSGLGVGTLCVMDRRPRTVTPDQLVVLETLGRQAVALLEARRVAAMLAAALSEAHALRGLLPLCAWCKSVRNDAGFWGKVEDYLRAHANVEVTHGMCPACADKFMAEATAGSPG